jgi:hypothetical protein
MIAAWRRSASVRVVQRQSAVALLFSSLGTRMRGEPGDAPNDIDVMVVGTRTR